jgi:hypothetical protein
LKAAAASLSDRTQASSRDQLLLHLLVAAARDAGAVRSQAEVLGQGVGQVNTRVAAGEARHHHDGVGIGVEGCVANAATAAPRQGPPHPPRRVLEAVVSHLIHFGGVKVRGAAAGGHAVRSLVPAQAVRPQRHDLVPATMGFLSNQAPSRNGIHDDHNQVFLVANVTMRTICGKGLRPRTSWVGEDSR